MADGGGFYFWVFEKFTTETQRARRGGRGRGFYYFSSI
jgi:hypothetical protein